MNTQATIEQTKVPMSFLPPYIKWGLLALVQLSLIAIPLVDRLQVQMGGEEVTLALIPVDPRDLLRGDYVIINLEIGRLSADLPGASDVTSGDDVFVELQAGETGVMEAVSIHTSADGVSGPLISGTVLTATGEDVRIDYGIDAFFLPEGEGLIIEDLETDRVRLVVSVADDGRSLPLRLLVDGKPFKSDAAF